MIDPPSRAADVAQQLWANAELDSATADVSITIDKLLTGLEAGLRRWIGAEGYAALLRRAIDHTMPTHPALCRIPDLTAEWSAVRPVVEASSQAMREAVIALLESIVHILGGIIGEDMAVRLVELSGTSNRRDRFDADTNDTPS